MISPWVWVNKQIIQLDERKRSLQEFLRTNLKFEVEEDDWKLESELIETPWWTRKPTIKDKLGHGKIKDMIK